MRILFATSEVYPLIKTGGLADVSHSLCAALKQAGHDVKIILPCYRTVKEKIADPVLVYQGRVFGYIGEIAIYKTTLTAEDPVDVLLVDAPDLFDRNGGPYADEHNSEWNDSAYRFAIFSRVVAMLGNNLLGISWRPDVVHCNDWQTGLAIPLLQLDSNPPATLFTIHNLAYQGNFSREEFEHLHLPEAWWSIDGMEFHGQCSFLKAGVLKANWVTTVSPTYARETQTPEYGERFDGILTHRRARYVGILNGVDYQQWDPQTDPYLDSPYSAGQLEGKANNKKALQKQLGLPVVKNTPLFGMVCRMAYQKGIDLLIESLSSILQQKLQLVVLGSGDIYYETALKKLAAEFPQKLTVCIGYDEELSHRIEAGSDFFLMPSRYEPCGLNQIYSLRYGSLPVVRNTGGLADTVIDATTQNISTNCATGIVFEKATTSDFLGAIRTAMSIYQDKALYSQMQRTAMSQEFSWQKSSQDYQRLYRQAVNEQCTKSKVNT